MGKGTSASGRMASRRDDIPLVMTPNLVKEEQNFAMMMEMLAAAEVQKEDEEYESPLDILLARLEVRDPESIALKQYHVFKMGGGETTSSTFRGTCRKPQWAPKWRPSVWQNRSAGWWTPPMATRWCCLRPILSWALPTTR